MNNKQNLKNRASGVSVLERKILSSRIFMIASFLIISPIVTVGQNTSASDSPHLNLVVMLRSDYVGEEQKIVMGQKTSISYLSISERKKFEADIKNDGRLYYSDGSRIHTGYSYMYVMDQTGQLYIAPSGNWNGMYLKHSSFLAGGPVAGAGMITTEDGQISTISRGSGHYHPPKCLLEQVKNELIRQGADLSNAIFIDDI